LSITISRSQSRITSSTLSIWKNTYSNFNMVTLDIISMTTITTNTTTPCYDKDFPLIRLWVIICPAVSPSHLQNDNQQHCHRHWHDLRHGHHSLCPPSTDHSTKTTALFLTETAKQNFKRHLKEKTRAKIVYLTILKVIDKCFKWKSAYHLEDITECSKFPRFLFQFFFSFLF
jgi:hypothetical protein